jgi:uncharacterized protein
MDIKRKQGFDFDFDPGACRQCPGNCCRGESGHIWVNKHEISQISLLLKINTIDCINNYLVRVGNRFSIKERFLEPDFECVFFDGSQNRCAIYAVRPLQCSQYPFWERFKKDKGQLSKECPGIIEADIMF